MPIRLKIFLGCLAMLSITVGLGLYERQQANALGKLAVSVYEQSLLSISYARSAQVGFIRLAPSQRLGSALSDKQRAARLKDLFGDLDVAIERAASNDTRAMGRDLRARIVSSDDMAKVADNAAGSAIDDLDKRFDNLVETLTGDAFNQRSEVDAMNAGAEHSIRIALAASVATAVLITFLLSASIVRPVRRAVSIAGSIAEGRLDNTINLRGRNETARLLQALSRMQTAIASGIAEREARMVADLERQKVFEHRLSAALRGMADTVEADATTAVDEISQRTRAMAGTADDMRQSASRTEDSSHDAADAAGRALATSQSVASAAEQLAASIREISTQVNHSTVVVGRAVTAAGATRAKIETLNGKVAQIGSVADIIAEIAARTNLLALNATIEAARAGDAGKGFAVVAGEVKQLAVQTSRSTAEIGAVIREVRFATSASIEAVTVIEQMISEINEISTSISAAVEQQGAATAEIARNVTETAQAADLMNERIARVAGEARTTGLSASGVGDSAAQLAVAMADLKRSLVRVVRSSTGEVNRRVNQRNAVEIACHLNVEGSGSYAGRTLDISAGGVKVRLEGGSGLQPGARGTLTLAGTGTLASGTGTLAGTGLRLSARVVAVEGDTARLGFAFSEAQAREWQQFVDSFADRLAA